MAKAGRCSSRAAARPGASSTFESTTAISAPGRRCSLIALAIARKFEPLPERRMPSRCMKDLLSLILGEFAGLIVMRCDERGPSWRVRQQTLFDQHGRPAMFCGLFV